MLRSFVTSASGFTCSNINHLVRYVSRMDASGILRIPERSCRFSLNSALLPLGRGHGRPRRDAKSSSKGKIVLWFGEECLNGGAKKMYKEKMLEGMLRAVGFSHETC